MDLLERLQPIRKEYITCEYLISSKNLRLEFQRVNPGIGAENKITDPDLHRPGLALAGYTDLFTHHRVQIFGNTEIYYLESLNNEQRVEAFHKILQFPMPCIILTNNHALDAEIVEMCSAQNVPILRTAVETTQTIYRLSEFLQMQFAPQVVMHGSFMDVYGVGIMFVGRSGIGKSEIALDLIERGHRLVADDVVLLTKKSEDILIGIGTSLVKHFMEIRGLGIIDVQQMFGIRSIRYQKRLEIVVQLEEWDPTKEYTRTGLDVSPVRILDVDISFVRLPIFPGKNITVIAEVIALNYLLRTYGYDAAKEFTNKLEMEIARKMKRRAMASFDTEFPQFGNDVE